jgi:hypothetical protein
MLGSLIFMFHFESLVVMSYKPCYRCSGKKVCCDELMINTFLISCELKFIYYVPESLYKSQEHSESLSLLLACSSL